MIRRFGFLLIIVLVLSLIGACNPFTFSDHEEPEEKEEKEALTGEPTVSSRVKEHVLEDAGSLQVTEESISFRIPSGESLNLAAGDILVLPVDADSTVSPGDPSLDNYPFRRVLESTSASGGELIQLAAEPAPLSDVLQTATIALTNDTDLTAEGAARSIAPRVLDTVEAEFKFSETLWESADGNFSAEVKGSVALSVRYSLNMVFNDGLRYFGVLALTEADTEATLTLSGSGDSIDESIELGNLANLKVFIPGLPIPLWIDISLPFTLDMKGSIDTAWEGSYSRSDSIRYKTVYDAPTPGTGEWLEPEITFEKTAEELQEGSFAGNLEGTFSLGPSLCFHFYSTAGPEIVLPGFIQLGAAAASPATAEMPRGYEWGVNAGYTCSLGIGGLGVEALGQILDQELADQFSNDLYEDFWNLAYGPRLQSLFIYEGTREISGVEVSKGTRYPLDTLTLYAEYDDDQAAVQTSWVEWELKEGGGSMSGASYDAPGQTGTATLAASFQDRNQFAREYTLPEEISAELEVDIVGNMRFIEAGSFTMGTEDDASAVPMADPAFTADLSRDYELSKYEVTNNEFLDFLNSFDDTWVYVRNFSNLDYRYTFYYKTADSDYNFSLYELYLDDDAGRSSDAQINSTDFTYDPASGAFGVKSGRENWPVRGISWMTAVLYANFASEAEGFTPCYTIEKAGSEWNVECDFKVKGYRLPTEAEWEYAARSGGSESGPYPGGSSYSGVAVYDADTPSVVGSMLPTAWGFYDMAGNVAEFCWDVYESYDIAYGDDPGRVTDPRYDAATNDAIGSWQIKTRTLRGGSHTTGTESDELKVYAREQGPDREALAPDAGIRLARTR